jgi:hypothetical protein
VRVGLRTNRRLVRQAVARALHQDSARKGSRSFLPAAFGLLRIVRCPCLTISEGKANLIHKLYTIYNNVLKYDNNHSVRLASSIAPSRAVSCEPTAQLGPRQQADHPGAQ